VVCKVQLTKLCWRLLAWVCALTKLKLKSSTSASERKNSRYWLMCNKYNKAIISFTWVETSVLKVEQMEISQEGKD